MPDFTKTAICFLVLSLSPFSGSSAWAWGSEGHRIIASIAWDKLTPVARQDVGALLGSGGRAAMEQASTWADEIRPNRRETAPWHYVNIEISSSGYEPARDCPHDDCVIAQVQRDARIIADRQLAMPVRSEALRFLIHFVGDLHQPLHCADNHDRGGSDVRVAIGIEETNLHAVWDTDVVASLGEEPDAVASALEAQITPEEAKAWSLGSPVDWGNETFGVAKRAIYSAIQGEGGTVVPIVLPADYPGRERALAATQLEKAGMRLAALLNSAFAQATISTEPAREIGPEAASSHVGETVTVKGVIASVYRSRSGVTFLDMGDRYPQNTFTGVIFPEDGAKFPDAGMLSGKMVEINGLVQLYRGKPEIILRTISQLTVE
jgi:hypothetical protein